MQGEYTKQVFPQALKYSAWSADNIVVIAIDFSVVRAKILAQLVRISFDGLIEIALVINKASNVSIHIVTQLRYFVNGFERKVTLGHHSHFHNG